MAGTRRRLNATERKREILGAAMAVFAAKGFEGATSRDLARASGASEALIYKYFPTKEALYRELVTLVSDNKDAIVKPITQREPSTKQLVETYAILGWVILIGPPGRPKSDSVDRLIAQSLLGDGTFAVAALESLFYPLLPYLEACFDAAVIHGDVSGPTTMAKERCILAHHTIGAMALFGLPPKHLLPIEGSRQVWELTVSTALRGLGLSPTAMAGHADFNKLEHLVQKTLGEKTTP